MTIVGLDRLGDPSVIARLSEPERARARAMYGQLERVRGRWAADPVGWVRHVLGGHVTAQQAGVLEAIRDSPRVVVSAGHSVGKSKTVARATLWWVDTHPPGEAIVVTTAPTFPQVRAIVWREIRAEHRHARLSGKVNQVEWLDGQGDLVAFGRKPSDYDQAAFQGIHAPYVLVLIDEASGVPAQLWDDAEKLTTGPQHRLIAIGNPDHQGSHFHAMSLTPGWEYIRLNVLDSPNFTAERDATPEKVAMALAAPEWVDERAERYGIGSPTWMRQVTGEFPAQKEGGLIPRQWLSACADPERIEHLARQLRHTPERYPAIYGRSIPRVQLGVDVAAGGEDETVVRERRGLAAGRVWTFDLNDSEAIIAEVVGIAGTTGADRIVVDSIGVGFGVLGGVRAKLPEVDVQPFNAAETPDPPLDPSWPKFKNKRAQLWWMGRELSRTKQWDTTMLFYDEAGQFQRDDPTADDLCAPVWVEKNGVVEVESKDDIRKELGRSPDHGEATLLAFWLPGRMRARVASPAQGSKQGWSI